MKLIEVEWVDSIRHTEWQSRDELIAWVEEIVGANHRTVGYLLYENDSVIALAQNVSDPYADNNQPNLCGIMAIPKVAVTKTTVLRD